MGAEHDRPRTGTAGSGLRRGGLSHGAGLRRGDTRGGDRRGNLHVFHPADHLGGGEEIHLLDHHAFQQCGNRRLERAVGDHRGMDLHRIRHHPCAGQIIYSSEGNRKVPCKT